MKIQICTKEQKQRGHDANPPEDIHNATEDKAKRPNRLDTYIQTGSEQKADRK